MTPEDALEVMNFVADTWQNFEPGENTAAVWAMKLASVDVDDARQAVMQLAGTDEWAPSLARVLEAAKGFAKRRDTMQALPPARREGDQSARAMAALNALYRQFDRPAHDHRKGRDACPCCTTSADRLKVFCHEAADLLHDFGIHIDPDRATRYATQGMPG